MSHSETWEFIHGIRIDTLIIEDLSKHLDEIFKKYKITAKPVSITREVLGNYFLPWYSFGHYPEGKLYRVKEYPKAIKLLQSEDDLLITVIFDEISERYLIIDGGHRAVAIHQLKTRPANVFVLALYSPMMDLLFSEELASLRTSHV